ncbi:MAG: phosphomannomutase/phosphoglucomutase [Bacilli bacterium]
MNAVIFRAYDIRGKYPSEIDESGSYKIGKSYGTILQEKYKKNTCIVSYDNRLSSTNLATNLIKGITSTGCNVINYGLTTTPMNYYGRYLNQLPGIMVTASHNPKDDNGFKFSFDGVVNARGEMIDEFKDFTFNRKFMTGNGTITKNDITEKYLEYLKYSLKFGKRKRKVIVDCGNGATCIIAKKIFNSVYANVEIINEKSDGTFPNHHPDPTVASSLVQLQKRILEKKADFGVSFDGDGDRIGVVNNLGQIVPIENIMILYIRDMINNVKNKTFLYDIKCSKSLEDEIIKLGGTPLMYRTGASYTQNKVHTDSIPFGGEYSGHLFFQDRDVDCGSAIYATLRLMEIMSKCSDTLSNLCSNIPVYFHTDEIKIPCTSENKFKVIDKIKEYANQNKYPSSTIDGIKIFFTNGWVLIRASNTGENITFRAEATTDVGLNSLQNIFLNLINEYNN